MQLGIDEGCRVIKESHSTHYDLLYISKYRRGGGGVLCLVISGISGDQMEQRTKPYNPCYTSIILLFWLTFANRFVSETYSLIKGDVLLKK